MPGARFSCAIDGGDPPKSAAQVKSRALTHYYAGISAKQLGNLEEAEKEFDKALSLQPGDEQAQQQLQEIQQQKPAERREQRKETKVEAPPPSAQPVQPAQPGFL